MASNAVVIRILGDASNFKRSIGETEAQLGKLDTAGKKIGGAFKAMAGGIAAAGIGTMFKGALDAAAEANKVAAQTDAVVKSTGGAAGVSAEHVGKLAHSLQNLSGVSDEAIQTGQNMLLTFTNIRNGVGKNEKIFDEASKTLLDMSVAMGTDAKSSAIQLGKALNDPIKGVGALSRVGVTFTDQQKAQIKALVESGDVMGAQKVILAELNKEFGGSAKAAGDAQTPMQRLSLAFGDIQETIGTKLLPVIEKLATWISKHQSLIIPLAAVVGGALVAAFTAWAISAAQAAAATLAAAAPVIAIGAAIAALVAGIIYAYQNFDIFRNTVDAVWQALQVAWGWITKTATAIFEFGKKAVGFLADFTPLGQFLQHLPEILGLVRDAFGWVVNKISALIDLLKKIPKLADKALGPLDEIVGKGAGIVGKIGGAIGKLPGFDSGGMVPGPIGRPQLAVVHGGETILPTHRNRMTGGVYIDKVRIDANGLSKAEASDLVGRTFGWRLAGAGGL